MLVFVCGCGFGCLLYKEEGLLVFVFFRGKAAEEI